MLKKVWEPIHINSLEIKNRIGLPSMVNMPGGEDGFISDSTIRWYEMRAAGGAGLIMTGAVVVTPPTPEGLARRKQFNMNKWVGVTDDKYIPGWQKMVAAMHKHGAKLGVQTVVLGPQSGLAPSLPPYPDAKHAKLSNHEYAGTMPPVIEVPTADIEKHIQDTVDVAVRLKKGHVDVFELHLSHGGANLYSAWLSPMYNRRTDGHGGSWANRLKMPCETIQRLRQALGKDYPILVRIPGDELMGKYGITLEDTCKILIPALEEAGVDAFDVSQGSIMHSPEGIVIPMYYPRGVFINHAAQIKKVTKKPVIGVGRIVDMRMAEQFLEEGKADMIFMGRQLVADPETPKKWLENHADDVRGCIGCLAGCGRPCPVNYDIQEEPIPMTACRTGKKVLVVGGGVGGMEAARIATLRGHHVTLWEKEPELGGMVGALARTKLTSEFQNFLDYLGIQMRKLKVDVRVCKEATVKEVEALKPDVIINATGSSMVIPEIAQGKPGVIDHIEACKNQRALGQRVVIWGLVAAELAISLAEAGKDVVMIGRGGEETLARDYPGPRRYYVLRKLLDMNAVREWPPQKLVSNPRVMFFTDVEKITPGVLHVVDGQGKKGEIPFDTFIISRERACNNAVYEMLKGKAPEVYNIGDSNKVGDIKEAVWAANEVARKI
ncbi:MAG: FAD-dependent oxidoreductase [Dehalococcoidales bacterium]|nr:FAD-dependent oxidoreductase [Dehalococcoidales bacterium]